MTTWKPWRRSSPGARVIDQNAISPAGPLATLNPLPASKARALYEPGNTLFEYISLRNN